jgi:hypothetical protein
MIEADLLRLGLVQFGHLNGLPFAFRTELLPSYPGLLRLAAEMAVPQVHHAQRLFATTRDLPFALAVALVSGLPLVVAQQVEGRWTVNGAYDIGHPAVLLLTRAEQRHDVNDAVALATRTGLILDRALALFAARQPLPADTRALTTLSDVVAYAECTRKLPAPMAQAVREWIG